MKSRLPRLQPRLRSGLQCLNHHCPALRDCVGETVLSSRSHSTLGAYHCGSGDLMSLSVSAFFSAARVQLRANFVPLLFASSRVALVRQFPRHSFGALRWTALGDDNRALQWRLPSLLAQPWCEFLDLWLVRYDVLLRAAVLSSFGTSQRAVSLFVLFLSNCSWFGNTTLKAGMMATAKR